MSSETEAVKLVTAYKNVIDTACAMSWRKWRAHVEIGGIHAAFTRDDIRQIAVEAILLLAGMLPGRKGNDKRYGSLATLEAEGGERYVQHAVNWHVSGALLKLASMARADFRGGDAAPPESLDAVPAGFDGPYRPEHRGALETSSTALTGISLRFPLLTAIEMDGSTHAEAAKLARLTEAEFHRALRAEIGEFAKWARANRRVKEGAAPRRNAMRECPYGEPSCTGVHTVARGRLMSDLCPATQARRRASRAESNAKRRKQAA